MNDGIILTQYGHLCDSHGQKKTQQVQINGHKCIVSVQ